MGCISDPRALTNVGEVLRKCREDRGISVRQLAERVGIGRSTLSRWELGKSRIGDDELDLIAEGLGLPAKELRRVVALNREATEVNVSIREETLRALRVKANLPLQDAATALGVSKSSLSRWENGVRRPPAIEAKEVAIAYGVESEVFKLSHSIEELTTFIAQLRDEVQQGVKRSGVDFLLLEDVLQRMQSPDRNRALLLVWAANIERLGWWYRDARAARLANTAMSYLGDHREVPVWGRILRARSNYLTEIKGDAVGSEKLLRDSLKSLIGMPSEAFVRRELAAACLGLGRLDVAQRELDLAIEAPCEEETIDSHRVCCQLIQSHIHLSNHREQRAIETLPSKEVRDPYLRSSSAIGVADVYAKIGAVREAAAVLFAAEREARDNGFDHFVNGLARRRMEAERLSAFHASWS